VPATGLQVAESLDLIDLIRLAAQPTANLIRIDVEEDGTVGFDLHRSEVGQGINTAVAMVIAEEMGIPVESVRIRQADARPELLFNQLTGGSNSMYTIYEPVRVAAAVARQRLLQAAALLVGSLTYPLDIVDGLIRTPDGRSLGIGDLARRASSAVTEVVDVETRSGPRTVVGTPRNRIDARAMVTGQQTYVADLDVADALPTMVARPPTVNGRPTQVRNMEAVLEVPGVTDVALSTPASPSGPARSASASTPSRSSMSSGHREQRPPSTTPRWRQSWPAPSRRSSSPSCLLVRCRRWRSRSPSHSSPTARWSRTRPSPTCGRAAPRSGRR
jgi:isoquinoline 1-oxidoreductase beta subunit